LFGDEKNGKVILTYDDVGTGLHTQGDTARRICDRGEDKKWYGAEAKMSERNGRGLVPQGKGAKSRSIRFQQQSAKPEPYE
jgi:hypothetical protein